MSLPSSNSSERRTVPSGSVEGVVGRHFAAERQLPPLLRDRLGVPAQRDLLVEQRVARGPVLV